MRVNCSTLSKLFLESSQELKKYCGHLISKYDLRYQKLSLKEYKILIKEIISRIDSDKQIIAHPNRKKIWQEGWLENFNEYKIT